MTGRLKYGDLQGPEVAGGRIVDVATWHAVQGMRQSRPARSKGGWLLTGLATCGTCSRNLHPVTDGDGYRRYRCAHRACPSRVSVSALRIEPWVVARSFEAGDEVETRAKAPDLGALEDALAKAEARYEQAKSPDVSDAMGDDWAAYVKARRLERDDAATALGQACQVAGVEAASFRLRDVWDGLYAQGRGTP